MPSIMLGLDHIWCQWMFCLLPINQIQGSKEKENKKQQKHLTL